VATNDSVAEGPDGDDEDRESRRNDDAQAGSGLRDRTTELLVILVLAFFAGFSERIVKQLAERMRFRDVAADLIPAGAPQDRGTGGVQKGTGERSALTGDSAESPAAGGDEEDHSDGCLADHEVSDEDATDDTQLPAACGGVEDAAQITN
jgi:hypothetical protein